MVTLLLILVDETNRRARMFLTVMGKSAITRPVVLGIDWKGLGYLVSILSVFLLGSIAWPKPEEPRWHIAALVAGMATSILGMAFRYKAHLDQQRELKKAEAKAERR